MRRTPRTPLTAGLVVAAVGLTGCGGSFTSGGGDDPNRPRTSGPSLVEGCTNTPPTTPAAPRTYDAPPAMVIDPTRRYTATLRTSCGTMVVRLDAAAAPKTVNNFVFLARQGFYNGLTFHRVVRDFVIQTGDPKGDGTGDAGYEIPDELPSTPYKVGELAMANSGSPDTGGSQFFIITGLDGENLPLEYSRFGKVITGLNTGTRIESLAYQGDADRPGAGLPRQVVWLYSVTITQD